MTETRRIYKMRAEVPLSAKGQKGNTKGANVNTPSCKVMCNIASFKIYAGWTIVAICVPGTKQWKINKFLQENILGSSKSDELASSFDSGPSGFPFYEMGIFLMRALS